MDWVCDGVCAKKDNSSTLISHLFSGEQHTSPFLETELASFVDTILEDQDHNNDGYIDYPEFVSSLSKPPGETGGTK